LSRRTRIGIIREPSQEPQYGFNPFLKPTIHRWIQGCRPGKLRNTTAMTLRLSLLVILLLSIGICLVLLLPRSSIAENRYDPWLIYYHNQLPVEAFSSYRLLVFDADAHPPLAPLTAQGKKILGYISLGEVEQYRRHFEAVKSRGLLLEANPVWPDSYFIDIRHPFWAELVVTELIPAILARGFDGIFLDTLDNPIELERREPMRYQGMTAAAVDLIRGIRLHFPNIKIMMNRAYPLIEKVAPFIDMILGESVYTNYDFENRTFRLATPDAYRRHVEQLREAGRHNPRIGLYSLDYWDPKDTVMLKRIYDQQRRNGLIPYVATIELNQLVEEPQ
jgi:polysaccharide biosynthesis protein PelA